MAIYFPNAVTKFQKSYTYLVNFDADALSGWMGFLQTLYVATAQYAAMAKGARKHLCVIAWLSNASHKKVGQPGVCGQQQADDAGAQSSQQLLPCSTCFLIQSHILRCLTAWESLVHCKGPA